MVRFSRPEDIVETNHSCTHGDEIDKKIVHQFEEFKISLSAISKLAELDIERALPVFTINQDPKIIAKQVRKELYPDFNSVPKEFLRALISTFAENNIFIFEFVETWNKKEKSNIDGKVTATVTTTINGKQEVQNFEGTDAEVQAKIDALK